MDSSGPIYDEVIADSEGEMDEEEDSIQGIMTANSKDIANAVSQVSAFTFTEQLQGNQITSSISAFTAAPPAFWKQSTITDDTSNQLGQISDIDNFIGTVSIADRAKMRQRNPKPSIQSSSTKPIASGSRPEKQRSNANLSSDVIELTSDEDDDELSLRPSKPRPRPIPKPKMEMDMNLDKTYDASGTAGIGTDKSAEPNPDPRPRPRPRPLVKRSKTAHDSTIPPPLLPPDIIGLLPSSSASASHGPDLPIATSPVQPHIHTSQLPPSDPPLPTHTTIHDEGGLPQIEILPDLDFDGPLSSPSSLFSDLGGSAKKRKRTVLDLDIDELASDDELTSGQGGIGTSAQYNYDNNAAAHVPPHMLPPPPTFFAGSSSSSTGGGGGRRIPPLELGSDTVDLTMLPPTNEPTGAAATKKTVKANKSRQKKVDTIIDEDELDDDFDPMESTKKGKPKPKPKAKKSADAKARPSGGRRQVEVSIVSKPRTQNTKNKGKEKATAGNKDAFKSREFIDDSGDEQDPIQLIPNTKDSATGDASHSTSTNKKDSAVASIKATSTPLSKTLPKDNSLATPDDKFDSGNTMVSPSSNRMNKKRKSVIESEPDDADEAEKDQPALGVSLKKRKGKQGKDGSKIDQEACSTIYIKPPAATKKGKKGKNLNVVRSDKEDEDNALEVDLDRSPRRSEGQKPASVIEDEGRNTKQEKAKRRESRTKSKKAVDDAIKDNNNNNNPYMKEHEDIQGQPPAAEAEVAKENVISPMKTTTTKPSEPDMRRNNENPGLFPSLHSRYEIAPRRSSLPMSELIRRANSIPGSPFATPHPRTPSSSAAKPPKKSGPGITTYSPYLKSSRSVLSRIAPLHPNRRTPPPPPPPPPPKKKTKKELEMEEKWEEEMIDSVGGISEWACLADNEKKELRRAKWAREMGDWDD